MKSTETKLEFVKARAEGKSYSTIQEELGISKATCSNWEKELKADIDALQREHMEELYTSYNMQREARIKSLGEILNKIDAEIEKKAQMSYLNTKDLLDFKLKYTRELRAEYIAPVEVETDDTLDGLLEQYNQLYRDSKAGKYKPADIKAQLAILDGKRDILYRLTEEQDKEGKDPLSLDLSAYNSRLIRHPEKLEA